MPSSKSYLDTPFNNSLQSLKNLAWFRKLPIDDPLVGEEFTEILATVKEERESKGAWHECMKKGNWIRFAIAISIFTLQQWSGQVRLFIFFKNILLLSGVYCAEFHWILCSSNI